MRVVYLLIMLLVLAAIVVFAVQNNENVTLKNGVSLVGMSESGVVIHGSMNREILLMPTMVHSNSSKVVSIGMEQPTRKQMASPPKIHFMYIVQAT